MAKIADDKIKTLLERGVAEVIVREHLESALRSGKKLRVKFGVDPTAADLHLGHAVALRKLRQFQDLGHKIVIIIGDYTARIGDPSGKSKTRPVLSEEEIEANAETYFNQVSKFIDVSAAEIRYNSEWFGKEQDWALSISGGFSLQRLLERDDFTRRLKEGAEITVREILYPTMQAYDSIKIKADVEIGGTDQKFNMLAGRDLQRRMNEPEQDIITVSLLVGTDGVHKMSKSFGNYIGITEAPNVMFGKIMAAPDELIDSYYELCTDIDPSASSGQAPRAAKLELGRIIVDIYHGAGVGEAAREEFIRVFSKKEKPSEIQTIKLNTGSLKLLDLLIVTKMAKSKTEARRLILQKAVHIDDVKQTDPEAIIVLAEEKLLQVGPRKFVKVVFDSGN